MDIILRGSSVVPPRTLSESEIRNKLERNNSSALCSAFIARDAYVANRWKTDEIVRCSCHVGTFMDESKMLPV